ncbi:uncharacterized protein LOC123696811 [Colias croceus]|uniref:uncharacterized protein LOC123696811 n=1 Tax=Colias crocea TaxID=72248 RepID=UPI001E27AE8F|nr:uncharacterized protein LOC123696811 [Colias croceus]
MKYIYSEDKCKALQDIVDSFQQCSSDHEMALSRIAKLECSLMEVQEDNPKRQCNTPSSLHDELVECGQLSGSVNFKKINFSSHKKLKKYLRLSKFIKRTQSIVRKSSFKNVVQLEKVNKNLVQELDKYHRDLEYYKILYDVETNELKEKIDSLSQMLNDVNQKYSAAQMQINEHIQQADDLIKLSNENMDRFESLTNKYVCQCSKSDNEQTSPHKLDCTDIHSVKPVTTISTSKTKHLSEQEIIVLSDSIGQGFGAMLNNLGLKVTNICTPNSSFNYIIKSLDHFSFNKNNIVIILYGDSLNIKNKDIDVGFQKMLEISSQTKCKFMLCTLPYLPGLTQEQNRLIHNMNLKLYNVTNHHRDAFLYFDINLCIKSFTLTKNTVYLPSRYKRELAMLIAYNINQSGTCLLSDPGSTIILCSSNNNYIHQPCVDRKSSPKLDLN